jgi:transposase-like protein
MACPRCSSESVTKDGATELGGQRFRCSRCGRRFTRRSSSAFTGRAFPDDIIALAVRWYVRYRLSYAEVGEWLAERGVLVDQSTIYGVVNLSADRR